MKFLQLRECKQITESRKYCLVRMIIFLWRVFSLFLFLTGWEFHVNSLQSSKLRAGGVDGLLNVSSNIREIYLQFLALKILFKYTITKAKNCKHVQCIRICNNL